MEFPEENKWENLQSPSFETPLKKTSQMIDKLMNCSQKLTSQVSGLSLQGCENFRKDKINHI